VHIVSILLILTGTFFFFSGTIGFLRFPDFYTRMHATGKCDTLGALFSLAGMVLYNGFSLISLKIFLIALLVFFTSPTATHAILRGAFDAGVEPWTKDGKSVIDAQVRRK
jgi:multicomponent Na+:H+ antiporter subunit G